MAPEDRLFFLRVHLSGIAAAKAKLSELGRTQIVGANIKTQVNSLTRELNGVNAALGKTLKLAGQTTGAVASRASTAAAATVTPTQSRIESGGVARQQAVARAAEVSSRTQAQAIKRVGDASRTSGGQLGAFLTAQNQNTRAGVPLSASMGGLARDMGSMQVASTKSAQSLVQMQFSMRSLGTEILLVAAKLSLWTAAAIGIGSVISVFTSVAKSIKDVNLAMINLGRVTGDFDEGTALNNFSNTFRRLRVDTEDVTTAVFEMGKAFGNANEAFAAAETVLLATKVAEIDVESGSRRLIQVSNAFALSGFNLTEVLDKLNEQQNTLGVELPKTLESVARAASVTTAAGGSIDELVGRTAVGIRFSGFEPSTVARANARIAQNLLAEAGQERIEGALAGTGINLIDEEGTRRSIDAVLTDIGGQFREFSAEQQQAVAESLSGGRKGNLSTIILTILRNFERVEQQADISSRAAGSGFAELADVLGSAEEQVKAVRAELNVFAVNAQKTGLVEVFGGLLAVLKQVLSTINDLGSLITSIPLAKFILPLTLLGKLSSARGGPLGGIGSFLREPGGAGGIRGLRQRDREAPTRVASSEAATALRGLSQAAAQASVDVRVSGAAQADAAARISRPVVGQAGSDALSRPGGFIGPLTREQDLIRSASGPINTLGEGLNNVRLPLANAADGFSIVGQTTRQTSDAFNAIGATMTRANGSVTSLDIQFRNMTNAARLANIRITEENAARALAVEALRKSSIAESTRFGAASVRDNRIRAEGRREARSGFVRNVSREGTAGARGGARILQQNTAALTRAISTQRLASLSMTEAERRHLQSTTRLSTAERRLTRVTVGLQSAIGRVSASMTLLAGKIGAGAVRGIEGGIKNSLKSGGAALGLGIGATILGESLQRRRPERTSPFASALTGAGSGASIGLIAGGGGAGAAIGAGIGGLASFAQAQKQVEEELNKGNTQKLLDEINLSSESIRGTAGDVRKLIEPIKASSISVEELFEGLADLRTELADGFDFDGEGAEATLDELIGAGASYNDKRFDLIKGLNNANEEVARIEGLLASGDEETFFDDPSRPRRGTRRQAAAGDLREANERLQRVRDEINEEIQGATDQEIKFINVLIGDGEVASQDRIQVIGQARANFSDLAGELNRSSGRDDDYIRDRFQQILDNDPASILLTRQVEGGKESIEEMLKDLDANAAQVARITDTALAQTTAAQTAVKGRSLVIGDLAEQGVEEQIDIIELTAEDLSEQLTEILTNINSRLGAGLIAPSVATGQVGLVLKQVEEGINGTVEEQIEAIKTLNSFADFMSNQVSRIEDQVSLGLISEERGTQQRLAVAFQALSSTAVLPGSSAAIESLKIIQTVVQEQVDSRRESIEAEQKAALAVAVTDEQKADANYKAAADLRSLEAQLKAARSLNIEALRALGLANIAVRVQQLEGEIDGAKERRVLLKVQLSKQKANIAAARQTIAFAGAMSKLNGGSVTTQNTIRVAKEALDKAVDEANNITANINSQADIINTGKANLGDLASTVTANIDTAAGDVGGDAAAAATDAATSIKEEDDDALQKAQDLLSARFELLKALAGGDTVKLARLALQEARQAQALGAEDKAGQLRQRAAVINAQQQLRDAILQSRIEDVDFALETEKITQEQAIAKLRELLPTTKGNNQKKRDLLLKIFRLSQEGGKSQQFGLGDFDLPTGQQLGQAISGGLGSAKIPRGQERAPGATVQNRNQITINVRSETDLAKVKKVVDGATGINVQRARNVGFNPGVV